MACVLEGKSDVVCCINPCVSTVLTHAGRQFVRLSDLVAHPDLLEKDRSVIVTVAVLYLLFLLAILRGQKKGRADDQFFVDGVKSKETIRISMFSREQLLPRRSRSCVRQVGYSTMMLQTASAI